MPTPTLQVHRAKFEIEEISAEMGETGALNNNMSRALTEAQGETVREAGLANQKVRRVRG